MIDSTLPTGDMLSLEEHDEYLVRAQNGVYYKGLLQRQWGVITGIVWSVANVPANNLKVK